MITLKTMKWSNLFSYGENNEVDFSTNPLTQIVGYNGHGKTSIALILEEALYNKNSKGIKKADILNRNNGSKSYSIELNFTKDSDDYTIKTVRGNTQTVKLLKNDEDISSHTATNTYKTIEELVGYDHKTFTQIVYQSSSASLEFLTATDSTRKKFLIDLLGLNKYVDCGEIFKQAVKDLELEIAKTNTKITSASTWIAKYKGTNLTKKTLSEVPESPRELVERCTNLKDSLKNIETTNKKILQNNKYKELRDEIVVEAPTQKPELDLSKITIEKVECSKTVKDSEGFILKLGKLGTQCPTCLQGVDQAKIKELLDEHKELVSKNNSRVTELEKVISSYEKELKTWQDKNDRKKLYEEYHALYDPNLEKTPLVATDLKAEIKALESEIETINTSIKTITEENNLAVAHNAKVDLVVSQLHEMQEALQSDNQELVSLTDRLNTLQLLVKTFSSTGLVAYKIECLVKDLEDITNTYLQDLSSGRFQIGFKISSNDKLNVVVTDHGKDIEITALSGGERARVNCAALLGIRKLMQGISNTRINLLVLDETIENLDLDGKEKLVEVLLKEPHLNTFIISHGFQHPLLEKIHVVKKNNISRIENG